MAKIYGQPGEEWGDRRVYEIMQGFSDDFYIYAQPPLIFKDKRRDPDYVIVHKKGGVIVLEVKDWVSIVRVGPTFAYIQRRFKDEPEKETSPVEQARLATFLLTDMLKESEDLLNYAGKLDFPYRFAAILPHIPALEIRKIEKVWGESFVFGRDDLDSEILAEKFLNISIPFTYKKQMSQKQMRAACAIIDKDLKITDPSTGKFRGIYDQTQEEIFKEPLMFGHGRTGKDDNQQSGLFSSIDLIDPEKRLRHLESEMPADIIDLKSNTSIRLLRGFAGTGKTDVLILRTNYLHKLYQDINILVTTFNKPILEKRLRPELSHLERVDVINYDKICADIHRIRIGKTSEVQNSQGVLSRLAETNPLIQEWGIDFLSDEFQWMKEINRVTRDAYIDNVREGRGGERGKMLSQQMKEQVFDIFEDYEAELNLIRAYDWADRRNMTLEFLQAGTKPKKKYDVILVDEAQHFAPNWMNILYFFLNPNGSLFICDDPSQSVYRFFSWKQKGVDVIGRTRWLRIPYRNTKQIFKAAFSLIADDSLAQTLLQENEGELLAALDHYDLREGPKPKVCSFSSVSSEKAFIKNKVEVLLDEGFVPEEIGVLHTQQHVVNIYKSLLPRGVNVYEARRQTGLEYSVVFIPQVQNLLKRETNISFQEDQSRQRMMAYMMMARARSDLYLSYQQKWPAILDPLRDHVVWCDEKVV